MAKTKRKWIELGRTDPNALRGEHIYLNSSATATVDEAVAELAGRVLGGFPTTGDFPPVAEDGAIAVDLANDVIYVYDASSSLWRLAGAGGGGGGGPAMLIRGGVEACTRVTARKYLLPAAARGGLFRSAAVFVQGVLVSEQRPGTSLPADQKWSRSPTDADHIYFGMDIPLEYDVEADWAGETVGLRQAVATPAALPFSGNTEGDIIGVLAPASAYLWDGASWNLISGGAPDATHLVKGLSRLSTSPVLPEDPIAVGNNDPRVPTQQENDALQGTHGAPSGSNRFVTDSDPRLAGSNEGGSGELLAYLAL